MRPSMWTNYLHELYPEEMVRVFSERGWRALELSDEHGHDLLASGEPVTVGAGFRAFAADHGIEVPQGHFYLATQGSRPGQRQGRAMADIAPPEDALFRKAMDEMRRWVDLFAAVGIRAGVLHAGGGRLVAEGWEPERVLARRVQAVGQVAEFARGTGVTICLENLMQNQPGAETAEGLLQIAEAVGTGNVAICLDTGHAHVCGLDIPAFIRTAGPALQALHIADNLGHSDDHMLPHGRGTVPWSPVMRALREVSYHGLFNYEVPGESRCPMPIRLAKLDYARAMADWMISDDGTGS